MFEQFNEWINESWTQEMIEQLWKWITVSSSELKECLNTIWINEPWTLAMFEKICEWINEFWTLAMFEQMWKWIIVSWI